MSAQLLETYNSVGDITTLAAGDDQSVFVLAQQQRADNKGGGAGGTTLKVDDGYQKVSIEFDEETKGYLRVFGWILMVAWAVFALSKFLIPGGGEGGGGGFFQKIGGLTPAIVSWVAIAVLLKPELLNSIINLFGRIGWTIASWFSSGVGEK